MQQFHFYKKPYLGFGFRLNKSQQLTLKMQKPLIDWLEIIAENYLEADKKSLRCLEKIRDHYPMVLQITMDDINPSFDIDFGFFKQVKEFSDRIEPAWISISGRLLSQCIILINNNVPSGSHNKKVILQQAVAFIQQIQNMLQRPLILKIPEETFNSNYQDVPEWHLISEIVKQTDCYISLDLNTILQKVKNEDYLANDYLNGLPENRVYQIQLQCQPMEPECASLINKELERLYAYAINRFGLVSTLIQATANSTVEELYQMTVMAREISDKISRAKDVA